MTQFHDTEPAYDRDNIRFNVLRNALYHTARRQHFERFNRLFTFGVVLLGASAMGDALAIFNINQTMLGAGVAFLGTWQLVYDFGGKARDHTQLQREYYHLLADIEAAPATEDQAILGGFYAHMLRITADEPPTLRAIDCKAYNDALAATELYTPDQRIVIPLWHRLTGWLFTFDGYNYPKVGELEAARRDATRDGAKSLLALIFVGTTVLIGGLSKGFGWL